MQVEQGKEPKSEGPIVASAAMLSVFSTLERISNSVVPVLIFGETGTGKEIVARSIHQGGPRRDKPFKCINCGGLPEQLIESTLFGYERGAFTGAAQRQEGVFEAGHEGTVFLDEIGELPLPAQASLLRVLETKKITRVGGNTEIPVDVRILAATHRDLEKMCSEGSFRWDLYYRLNVMSLDLPPLRERRADILPLAEHFMKAANFANRRSIVGLDEATSACLENYDWPGNVRELKNVIDRAVVIAQDDYVATQDLPDALRAASRGTVDIPSAPSLSLAAPVLPEIVEEEYTTEDLTTDLCLESVNLAQPEPWVDFKTQMQRCEIDVLMTALERTDYNQTEAAKRLQMPLRTLVYKIKTLGIRDMLKERKAS